MHRIDSPGATVDNKFTEGTPGLIAATQVSDDWLNDVQENMAVAIEDAGIGLVKGDFDQLKDAIQVYAALGGGSLQLKADDFSPVSTESVFICDASAASGSILDVTLPTAASSGAGKSFEFKKSDSSTNPVDIIPDGAETIDGLNSSVLLTKQNDVIKLVSDGSNWHVTFANLLEVKVRSVPSQALTAGAYASLTNNDLELTKGVWDVDIVANFVRTGTSDLQVFRTVLSNANASNVNFSADASVSLVESGAENDIAAHVYNVSTAQPDEKQFQLKAGIYRLDASVTCYLNALFDRQTSGGCDFTGKIIAKRQSYI